MFDEKKSYNNNTYSVNVYIYNDDISLSAPDLITNEASGLIPPASILYIMIENSLDGFIPRAELEFKDDAHALSNKIKAQNCRMHINIRKSAGDEIVTYNLTFIVKDYKILNASSEYTQYHIFGELDNAIPLNTLCEYATSCDLSNDNEQPENPYKIAWSILTQVGYKLYPLTVKNEDGKEIPTKYELPYLNDYCHFITYPNMRCIDALKYLFSYAVGENGTNPPAYLIHNLRDNKGYITTLENCFRPSSIRTQPKCTAFPFSITQSLVPNKEFKMDDVNTYSLDSGTENAQQFFNYKFAEYNQEERLWETYDISKLTLNDLLTRGITNSDEASIFLKMLKEDISLSKYYKYVPHSHPIFYDVMRNLELYSSNLQFSLDGDMGFDVGQVLSIYEKGQNDSKVEQFNGRWLVYKVQHSFKNKLYRTNLVLCRRFHKYSF